MSATDRISIFITSHGETYTTEAVYLERMIIRYLPASVADLKAAVRDMTAGRDLDLSRIHTVPELLMILAALHGYGE